jgi:hypothetical protein
MTQAQKAAVREIVARSPFAKACHGDCVGADAEFDEIAREHGLARYIFPCDIESARAHCELRGANQLNEPAKPLLRNRWIVNATMGGIMIATPKEASEVLRSGTWATVRLARRQGVTLHVIVPDGSSL